MQTVISVIAELIKVDSTTGVFQNYSAKKCTLIPANNAFVTSLIMNKKEKDFFFNNSFIIAKPALTNHLHGTYRIVKSRFHQFIKENSHLYKL